MNTKSVVIACAALLSFSVSSSSWALGSLGSNIKPTAKGGWVVTTSISPVIHIEVQSASSNPSRCDKFKSFHVITGALTLSAPLEGDIALTLPQGKPILVVTATDETGALDSNNTECRFDYLYRDSDGVVFHAFPNGKPLESLSGLNVQ